MYAVKTPEIEALEQKVTKGKAPVYQIVQYPDKASPSGKVFFVDQQVTKRFLFIFPYKAWLTVRGEKSGKSLYWFHLNECMKDVSDYKKGLKTHN